MSRYLYTILFLYGLDWSVATWLTCTASQFSKSIRDEEGGFSFDQEPASVVLLVSAGPRIGHLMQDRSESKGWQWSCYRLKTGSCWCCTWLTAVARILFLALIHNLSVTSNISLASFSAIFGFQNIKIVAKTSFISHNFLKKPLTNVRKPYMQC